MLAENRVRMGVDASYSPRMSHPVPVEPIPLPYEPKLPIETERLILRSYREDDLDSLYDIHRRPDVVRYLYWTERDRDQTAKMLTRRIKSTAITAENEGLVLAAERKDTGAMIGDISLTLTSAEHRQAEIGFILHPDHHGRGYGSEAAKIGLDLGFHELGLHRVFGRCDADNAGSAALMRRLGMRQEAHLRENEIFKGAWGDELVFAILAHEWPAH